MITAATAAALGLLGAILGMAGALVAGLAWAHSSLSAMFGDLPLSDVLILLVGLPLVAAAGGWLLAGREPAGHRQAAAGLTRALPAIPVPVSWAWNQVRELMRPDLTGYLPDQGSARSAGRYSQPRPGCLQALRQSQPGYAGYAMRGRQREHPRCYRSR